MRKNTKNMTVKGILTVIAVIVLFTGCSKKPNIKPTPIVSPFIGTWTISIIMDTETNNDVTSQRDCEAAAVSNFADNNSFTSSDSACSLYGFSGNWDFDGSDILTVKTTGGEIAWQGKVVFSADKKTFTLDETSAKGYIYTFKKK